MDPNETAFIPKSCEDHFSVVSDNIATFFMCSTQMADSSL